MSRNARLVVFLAGAAMLAVLVGLALVRLPRFGGTDHPYRTIAVVAAVSHRTANVVSSVNFDIRGLDTLGEESILLASVLGVAVLLRPAEDEEESEHISPGRILDVTGLGGYLLLPVTVLIGLDVIAHGHLTPGGGFQGGVIAGTGMHIAYVAGRYQALRRLNPQQAFEWGEALGAAGFAGLGLAALGASGAFLVNSLPTGTFGELFSSGTVGLLNGLVGIEVASGTMVLIQKFLQQAILIRREGSAR